MRGDRPPSRTESAYMLPFTPHARGSTSHGSHVFFHVFVYPACAGIDRRYTDRWVAGACLPRMRGDRPRYLRGSLASPQFTPHARGSTDSFPYDAVGVTVYPACAGIDRADCGGGKGYQGLPRMRGDGPHRADGLVRPLRVTPHPRVSTCYLGPRRMVCAVYPACAEDDPSLF